MMMMELYHDDADDASEESFHENVSVSYVCDWNWVRTINLDIGCWAMMMMRRRKRKKRRHRPLDVTLHDIGSVPILNIGRVLML